MPYKRNMIDKFILKKESKLKKNHMIEFIAKNKEKCYKLNKKVELKQ